MYTYNYTVYILFIIYKFALYVDKQPHTEDSTEMQNKANEALYDEIHISSEPPKTSIELETCPAFGMRRTGQAVYLFRNKVLSNPTVTDGIWRCTIPDQNGDQQTKYIGIYANGTTGQLTL